MRRALALAVTATLAVGGAASAETWTKYVDVANGTAWSIDSDYTYKDRKSGRLVVMQAISKPEAKLGPGAPGAADGVGSVVAIDCKAKNLITVGSYTPSKPLEIKEGWRSTTPSKASGPENAALLATVCPLARDVPVK